MLCLFYDPILGNSTLDRRQCKLSNCYRWIKLQGKIIAAPSKGSIERSKGK